MKINCTFDSFHVVPVTLHTGGMGGACVLREGAYLRGFNHNISHILHIYLHGAKRIWEWIRLIL